MFSKAGVLEHLLELLGAVGSPMAFVGSSETHLRVVTETPARVAKKTLGLKLRTSYHCLKVSYFFFCADSKCFWKA